MRPVRARHDGDGMYRYGYPGQLLGRFHFDSESGSVTRMEGPDSANPDPWITAALAVRWHWQKTGELPDRIEVGDPDIERESLPPRDQPAPRIMSGRLRRPDLKPVSVAELAARRPGNGPTRSV